MLPMLLATATLSVFGPVLGLAAGGASFFAGSGAPRSFADMNVTGTLMVALPPSGGSNCEARARASTQAATEAGRLSDADELTLATSPPAATLMLRRMLPAASGFSARLRW